MTTPRSSGVYTYWPDQEGGEWVRVLLGGAPAWQLTDREGDLVGLYDDDGERLTLPNCTWELLPCDQPPSWL